MSWLTARQLFQKRRARILRAELRRAFLLQDCDDEPPVLRSQICESTSRRWWHVAPVCLLRGSFLWMDVVSGCHATSTTAARTWRTAPQHLSMTQLRPHGSTDRPYIQTMPNVFSLSGNRASQQEWQYSEALQCAEVPDCPSTVPQKTCHAMAMACRCQKANGVLWRKLRKGGDCSGECGDCWLKRVPRQA